MTGVNKRPVRRSFWPISIKNREKFAGGKPGHPEIQRFTVCLSVWMGPRGDGRISRVHGLPANASKFSHGELDQAKSLVEGNPVEWDAYYGLLQESHRHLNLFGGCCGTDYRHVDQMSMACRKAAQLLSSADTFSRPNHITHLCDLKHIECPITGLDIGNQPSIELSHWN